MEGVSSVQIHNNEEVVTLTDKEAVEQAIASNNSKRFYLASSTPLMSQYMSLKMGYLATK